MFKIIAFAITTLLTQLYLRVDILLTHGKHLYDHINSPRVKKARNMSSHVFVFWGIDFASDTTMFYWIYLLQCCIFLVFYYITCLI